MFENLDSVMAVLVLFEEFLRQILFIFCLDSPESFTIVMLDFKFMRTSGVRIIVIDKVRNQSKIVFIKINDGHGWWEGTYLHIPPGSAPGYNL